MKTEREIQILVTNDDGTASAGLHALKEVAQEFGRVLVVAPDSDQSGTSHSLSLRRSLRVEEVEPMVYALAGTPTDCVLIGVNGLMERKPDLILSGINNGQNLGEDVVYSGTVAAAFEGNILGIPSIAVSVTAWHPKSFEPAADILRFLLDEITAATIPADLLLNVNVPDLPRDQLRGLRVTRLGTRVYENAVIRDQDERGNDSFRIWGGDPTWTPKENCDFGAVKSGYVSITPLHQELTDYKRLVELERWSAEWKG